MSKFQDNGLPIAKTFKSDPTSSGYEYDSCINGWIHPDTKQLHLDFDCNEFEPGKLIILAGKHFESEIRDWLSSQLDTSTHQYDWNTWEGGFNDFWGMGSATMFELALKFNFDFIENNVYCTIRT